uniref:RRM domain-containing protein n=2 Tax=Spongospora subterranea TaxID=70186 RepID=A0A0H5R9Q7_9EUKA|eukprot:CRZ10417.1 hypothetical protein [Spongospora subterranea]
MPPCRVLDVEGLSVDTTEEQLKQFLNCTAVDIPKDRRSGLSMGYGYAYFSTTELAAHALTHHSRKYQLNGNSITLQYSISRHPDRLAAAEDSRATHRPSVPSRSYRNDHEDFPAKGQCIHYPHCKKGDRCDWLHLDADGTDRRFSSRNGNEARHYESRHDDRTRDSRNGDWYRDSKHDNRYRDSSGDDRHRESRNDDRHRDPRPEGRYRESGSDHKYQDRSRNSAGRRERDERPPVSKAIGSRKRCNHHTDCLEKDSCEYEHFGDNKVDVRIAGIAGSGKVSPPATPVSVNRRDDRDRSPRSRIVSVS